MNEDNVDEAMREAFESYMLADWNYHPVYLDRELWAKAWQLGFEEGYQQCKNDAGDYADSEY